MSFLGSSTASSSVSGEHLKENALSSKFDSALPFTERHWGRRIQGKFEVRLSPLERLETVNWKKEIPLSRDDLAFQFCSLAMPFIGNIKSDTLEREIIGYFAPDTGNPQATLPNGN